MTNASIYSSKGSMVYQGCVAELGGKLFRATVLANGRKTLQYWHQQGAWVKLLNKQASKVIESVKSQLK